jgi:hypothetical protein
LLECQSCGAPVEASLEGGVVSCRYCGASNEVSVRERSDKAGRKAPSMADDVARLSRLKAQIDSPLTGHVYDLSQPPQGLTEPPVAGRLEWLKARWHEAKDAAADGQNPQAQHRLCWVAFKLADEFDEADKPDYERAVLETALEQLADDGHRHLVRCRLALEAIGEGDVASAEGWLAECDPIPEVPELDSAFRRAKAHIAAAKGDAAGVLGQVGREPGNTPIHPSQQGALWRLRIHALEALGEAAAADAALAAALKQIQAPTKTSKSAPAKPAKGYASKWDANTRESFFALMRKEKLGLRPLLRMRAAERDRVTGGTALAVATQLKWWPVRAFLLFVIVTVPRCFFDADPFLGVQGHVLCPALCEGCRGPWRVHTHWTHHMDEHSTDGPRYFCRPADPSSDRMSNERFFYDMPNVSKYELYVAPAMTTLLLLLGLTAPWIPYGTARARRDNERRREELDREVSAVAATLGERPPPARAPPGRVKNGLIVGAASVLVPLLITLLELAVR